MAARRKYRWPVVVTAETTSPVGTRISMRRTVEGNSSAVENIEAAMLAALAQRTDKGDPFLGCEITAIAPMEHIVRRVFDPYTRKLVL